MWQHGALQADQRKSGSKMTHVVLPENKNLLPNRPQLQRHQLLRLDNKIISTFNNDFSQVPSAIHNTTGHLRSRHMELSQWQTHITESIGRVDQEITAVMQMKDVVERCLHEKQVYSQRVSDCMALSDSLDLSSPVPRQDQVLSSLKKEEQLTNESRELLQNHVCMLLDNLSSLQKIHSQLLADFQDKCQSIKLTTRCITYDVNMSAVQLPAAQHKPAYVNYNDWLSHCANLRQTADELIKESSLFRRNVRWCLVHLKSSQDNLRHNTQGSMRRKIHKLARIQETLKWERKKIQDEISGLTNDIQKVSNQLRNCDTRLHQPNYCLEMLNQRHGYELCLDGPHISLTHERRDLATMAGGFSLALKFAQKDLELANKRLAAVEDKLAKTTRTLQVQQRCHNLHQSFLAALDNDVIFANKPKLHVAASSSRTYPYLQ